MATIKAGCTKCGGAFGVLDTQLGTEVQCPHCQARMKIPLLKRPSSASSSAPSSGADSALDAAAAAAAQLGAASKPKSRGDGLDDLLAATQQPAARSERVESRPAHGHTAGHSHLDSSEEGLPVPAQTGLMKNPGVVLTLAGGLVLIIIVFAYFAITNKNEVPDLDHGVMGDGPTQADGPMTAAKSAAMAAVFKKGEEGRGPVKSTVTTTEPLTLEIDKKPDEFFGRKNQLAHFAMFENKTSEEVERAAVTITVLDGAKILAEKTFVFRDVQPGQKVPAIIVYPFLDAVPKFQTKWRYWGRGQDKSAYKFTANVLGVRGYGDAGGTVTVEVRNESEAIAPVVDITAILVDVKTMQRSGYVTAKVNNLKPHEGRNVDIRWEGFDSEAISGGEAYAQLGGGEKE